MRGLAALVLVAGGLTAAAAAEGSATFTSETWGLSVRYPASLAVSTRFRETYFDRGAWRLSYAAGAGSGTPIVAFSLPDLRIAGPGGISEATAALRIGASRDPNDVATCLTYGMNSGNNVEHTTRNIGGLTFTEIPDNGDAAMTNTISSDDFRAVDGNTCWAIDIVRYAESPDDRRPDYAPDQIALLRSILGGIGFARHAASQ